MRGPKKCWDHCPRDFGTFDPRGRSRACDTMAAGTQETRTMHGDIVKRKMTKKVLSIFCCSVILSGSSAPAFAQVVRGGIGGAGVHAPAGAVLTGSPSAINPPPHGRGFPIQGSPAA